MQELKKIEQRKKEREKKALDLQKLITAADSNIEARRPERKTTKKAVVCKVKDTNVSVTFSPSQSVLPSGHVYFTLNRKSYIDNYADELERALRRLTTRDLCESNFFQICIVIC